MAIDMRTKASASEVQRRELYIHYSFSLYRLFPSETLGHFLTYNRYYLLLSSCTPQMGLQSLKHELDIMYVYKVALVYFWRNKVSHVRLFN